MINDNENEAENRLHRYNINRPRIRPRPRHGDKYIKCKMYLSIMMVICSKQHLSNI